MTECAFISFVAYILQTMDLIVRITFVFLVYIYIVSTDLHLRHLLSNEGDFWHRLTSQNFHPLIYKLVYTFIHWIRLQEGGVRSFFKSLIVPLPCPPSPGPCSVNWYCCFFLKVLILEPSFSINPPPVCLRKKESLTVPSVTERPNRTLSFLTHFLINNKYGKREVNSLFLCPHLHSAPPIIFIIQFLQCLVFWILMTPLPPQTSSGLFCHCRHFLFLPPNAVFLLFFL